MVTALVGTCQAILQTFFNFWSPLTNHPSNRFDPPPSFPRRLASLSSNQQGRRKIWTPELSCKGFSQKNSQTPKTLACTPSEPPSIPPGRHILSLRSPRFLYNQGVPWLHHSSRPSNSPGSFAPSHAQFSNAQFSNAQAF